MSRVVVRGDKPLLDFSSKQNSIRGITMHTLRKLRESGNPTPVQVSELLAENIVFNSPILVRPIEGRQVCAAIFAQSSATRGSGTYTAEFKLDERTTFLRWVGTMDGHKFESLNKSRSGVIDRLQVSILLLISAASVAFGE
jgi:hypothetical protein